MVIESTADLNGDGDQGDSVAFLYEPRTDTLMPTGLAIAPGVPFFPWARFAGSSLVLFAAESAQGADLNGDLDLADFVLHVVDADGLVSNTRVAGEGYDIHQGNLLFSRNEIADRRDWNRDGDRMDSILFAFDPRSSTFTSLAMRSHQLLQIRGERALLKELERLDARADLNGDGDMDDLILEIQDLATGRRLNTGLSLSGVHVAAATADGSFLVSASESQEGKDLNDDGDIDDFLLHAAE